MLYKQNYNHLKMKVSVMQYSVLFKVKLSFASTIEFVYLIIKLIIINNL